MKKIFFVTYGGIHANMVRLLFPELSRHFEVKILALTMASGIFSKAKIPYVQMKDYLGLFEFKEDVIRYGVELAKTEYNPSSGIAYDECVAYLGLGYWNLVKNLKSESAAKAEFERYGRKAFCPSEIMERIIRSELPNAVCVSCDVRMERAAGIAANSLGIPVIFVLDLPELSFPRLSFYADICVMNEYAREWILSNTDISQECVHVTGQPVLEDNTKVDYKEVETLEKRLDVRKYKNIIVYLEQPGYADCFDIEVLLTRMSEESPENLYIVKLHPNQEKREYVSQQNNFVVTRDTDLKALLTLSHIAITCDSNSGIEAAMMENILLTVEVKQKAGIDFSQYGISKKSVTIYELKDDIIEACKDREAFLEKYVPNRGKFSNTKNAVINIEKVIQRRIGDG